MSTDKKQEVLKLLVEFGSLACGDKVVYTINGAQMVAHVENIGKLQQLITKIDQGVIQVLEELEFDESGEQV